MYNFNLIDGFRMFHKNTYLSRRYTWRRKNQVRQSRLDYFLISDPHLDLVNSCEIRPGYRTDHSIVELTLTLCKFKRGKGIWKFNCSLLKQKEYLNMVNSLIEKEKEIYAIPVYKIENISHISDSDIQFIINDGQFLETLLLKIRGETIKFATELKTKTDTREKALQFDIETLEKVELANVELIEDKKKELQKIREDKLYGNIIRSRAQWLQFGEKPTKIQKNFVHLKITNTWKKQSSEL